MLEYSGRALFVTEGAEVGRLCLLKNCADPSCKPRILIVSEGQDVSAEDMRGVVGLVFLYESTENACVYAEQLSHAVRLPAIVLFEGEARELCADGRIAILDSVRHKLYVDPDIDTVNSYFLGDHPGKRAKVKLLKRADPNERVTELPPQFEGIVLGIPPSAYGNEQMIYELLCDTADTLTGARIVATVPFDTDRTALTGAVRAIYRASVWGRFSLLCSNIRSLEDAEKFIYTIKEALCQLEGEGRELNACIAKGAVIDTPLMLIEEKITGYFDFLCADFQRLRFFLTADPSANAGEEQTARLIGSFLGSKSRLALIDLGDMSRETLEILFSIRSLTEIYAKGSDQSVINTYK